MIFCYIFFIAARALRNVLYSNIIQSSLACNRDVIKRLIINSNAYMKQNAKEFQYQSWHFKHIFMSIAVFSVLTIFCPNYDSTYWSIVCKNKMKFLCSQHYVCQTLFAKNSLILWVLLWKLVQNIVWANFVERFPSNL